MEYTHQRLVKFDEIKYIAKNFDTFQSSHLAMKQRLPQALTLQIFK